MSVMQNPVNQPTNPLQRAWNWLTAPSRRIVDVTERRSARLASSFLFSILFLNLTGVLFRMPRLGIVEAFAGPIGFSIWILVPTYLLARTRWYRIAVFLFSVSFSSLAYVAMVSQGNGTDFGTQLLIYVPLSLIVASSFVSAPAVFLLVGLNIAGYLSIQNFGLQFPENIGPQAGMITIIGIVLMLLDNFRQTNEKIRLEELQKANRELEVLSTDLEKRGVELEQRVLDRTRNLELAAEVGRAVSQVRDLGAMLKDACDLILKEFDLYYVQVYLADENASTLKLEAGTGTVGAQLLGRNHSLPLDSTSINGRAAVQKEAVVISDTSQNSTFRPNLLLPETRGEMAVPLVIGDKVVGVLDMQSRKPGVLTNEILPAFEALAGQMAVAVQNANLLAETQQARAEVEAQARRLIRQGWNEHLDAIHKPEQIGYVFDRKQVMPLTETDEPQPAHGNSIMAPISVTGESLGSLMVELDGDTQDKETRELVDIVARQVAQQLENLRLLESAERYRFEAERTARIQTVEGWQKYIETRKAENLGFVYDTNQVKPHSPAQGENAALFTLPLMVREELIGKVSVQDMNHEDEEAVNLTNAVVDRLSAHIESLRLFEETKQGQMELNKRAQQLAAVAEISTASSQELEVDKLLDTVVRLTQREFGLYHAHIFIFNEATQELQIAACGWQEGDPNEGTHESNSIPLSKEQSLVARAARTGRSVIVNDVTREPGWLPNLLLPDTASEMAVPLIVGDRVLGVLDVQSDRINAFTEEDANIQTTLASQVATALQNARSFSLAQKQAEREAMLNVINQKIQSATSVEAVLQIAARELGTALGAPMTVAQLSMKDQSS